MKTKIMASKLKDLCRLCAKKNEFTKELLEETNKSVLDLIRQFMQLDINEIDFLPTKICLDCEEKMVSFQLFVLECYKAQDSLHDMFKEESSVKIEEFLSDDGNDEVDFGSDDIKSEIKDEFAAENIVGAVVDESHLLGDGYADENIVYYDDDQDDDGGDDEDNITIAALKKLQENTAQPKELTEEEAEAFYELLKKANLKIKDFVKMTCTICEETFKSWDVLRQHYYMSHTSKTAAYCKCGFVVRSKTSLYRHVTEHKEKSAKLRKFVDPNTNSYLGKCVKNYIKFTCMNCDKEFPSWYKLKSHSERIHKVPPIVQCSCGVKLKSKSVMYKHVQDHRNPTELSCDKCSLVTKSIAALNKHKMRHIPKSDRKFCCATCDKVFTNKDGLKSHEKSHIPIENRKVFHCDMCDMKFTTRSSATSHKRVVHEKIKSYVCDLCGYACGTNGELRQHRAIHSDEKPYVCKTCQKPFKTYSNLKTHMDTHGATSYECYVCMRVLNSRRTLKKHLLVHENKCRHVCAYCNKAFKRRQTLKVHMSIHTGDKPLSCKWCDERFAYASTLRSHRLRCHPDKMAAQTYSHMQPYGHVDGPSQVQRLEEITADVQAVQNTYIKNGLSTMNMPKSEA